jgi:site-specific DNA-methyltransferase (adenine-specific)
MDLERPDRFLLVGDSREAPALLPDLVGRVALAVTSPPYHNAIAYDSHVADPTANYRTRSSVSYAREYLPMLDEVWHACSELLRPGGFLAVNVGTVLMDGYHYPLPQDLVARLEKSRDRWEFVRSIIWNKVTAGVKRAGSVIRYALPGYWYPNILTEHIVVVRKPGAWRKLASDVPHEWWLPTWDLAPVPPGLIPHPAPFPEDLPHRLIRMLTREGEPVFDPFLGAGTTTKAALDLGRIPAGVDIEPSYVEHARRRLEGVSSVRGTQLRIRTVPEAGYKPGASRGRTRHGAGLGARSRRS